jgi:hypothetical protein
LRVRSRFRMTGQQPGQHFLVDLEVSGGVQDKADPFHVFELRYCLHDGTEGHAGGLFHRVAERTGGDGGKSD